MGAFTFLIKSIDEKQLCKKQEYLPSLFGLSPRYCALSQKQCKQYSQKLINTMVRVFKILPSKQFCYDLCYTNISNGYVFINWISYHNQLIINGGLPLYLYNITQEKIRPIGLEDIIPSDQSHFYGFISYEESEAVLQAFGLNNKIILDSIKNKLMKYENYEGFDLICINILDHESLFSSQENKICIYVGKNIKLFFCSNVSVIIKLMYSIGEEGVSIEYNRLISAFFEKVTIEDPVALEKIENEIYALEDGLISSKKINYVNKIISLRKKLMVFKQYYEQLLNILDGLQENENNLLSNRSLRHFKIFSGKVERLYHSVLHMRDYVTQVREAYQAQVDINLNTTMKIFTVITAIFLPLTLIVGWYGMNFQIPEFHWAFGYPMVIILSIAVVVFCLIYFKKHNWF